MTTGEPTSARLREVERQNFLLGQDLHAAAHETFRLRRDLAVARAELASARVELDHLRAERDAAFEAVLPANPPANRG